MQNVGDEGAKALATVDTLEDIAIHLGTLGVSGGCALAKSKITVLTIYGCYIFYDKNDNKIGDDAKKFIDFLIENKTIETLYLNNTCIYDDLLVKLIEKTKSIKSLYLEKNACDNELFKELCISQKEMYVHLGEETILLGEE